MDLSALLNTSNAPKKGSLLSAVPGRQLPFGIGVITVFPMTCHPGFTWLLWHQTLSQVCHGENLFLSRGAVLTLITVQVPHVL